MAFYPYFDVSKLLREAHTDFVGLLNSSAREKRIFLALKSAFRVPDRLTVPDEVNHIVLASNRRLRDLEPELEQFTMDTLWGSPQGDVELMTQKKVLHFKPAWWLEQIGYERCKKVDDRKYRIG